MEWTKNIETGIIEIDYQHRKFFELMDALLQLGCEGKEDDKIIKSIEMLKNYIRFHFSLEEDLMLESKYPHYKEHISAHRYFKEQIRIMDTMLKEQKEPSKALITRYNYMLVEWFLKHIKVTDKSMCVYLLEYREKNKGFLEKMKEILLRTFE